MKTNDAYQNAKQRVEAKIAFRNHVYVYIFINTLLIIINLFWSPDYFWAKWPMMGWGIALILHALKVYVFLRENFRLLKK
jgi:hypothetical protein